MAGPGRLQFISIRRCTELGYRQMVAIIGDSENLASIRLHQALGFTLTGTLGVVGFKFDRWVDCVTSLSG